MRAVIQRVKRASVESNGVLTGRIANGLLIFLGVDEADSDADLAWALKKIPEIRCFEDEAGRMNRSLLDVQGDALVISQFTLFGNLKKGTRPSFNHAALPDKAVPLYEAFVVGLAERLGKRVETGVFGAHMEIDALNDGPVTLILDSRRKDF